MRQKLLAIVLVAMPLFTSACGDDGGTASGKWVGEVYAGSKSKSSTVIGEFNSYDECVKATQKEAKSGVFNCGVK